MNQNPSLMFLPFLTVKKVSWWKLVQTKDRTNEARYSEIVNIYGKLVTVPIMFAMVADKYGLAEHRAILLAVLSVS